MSWILILLLHQYDIRTETVVLPMGSESLCLSAGNKFVAEYVEEANTPTWQQGSYLVSRRTRWASYTCVLQSVDIAAVERSAKE